MKYESMPATPPACPSLLELISLLNEDPSRLSQSGLEDKVQGWRHKNGKGRCRKCGEIKEAKDFPSSKGVICTPCKELHKSLGGRPGKIIRSAAFVTRH